jgi:O-antigen/teichoic acid export membrane protein
MIVSQEQQIKNSLVYLVPLIFSSLLPFVTMPIFTRILSKEDFGILALAYVYAIFLNGLANFGMTTVYDRNYFQYRGNVPEKSKLLYSILLFVMLNFFLLAAFTFIYRGTLSRLITGSVTNGDILFYAFCAQFFSSVNYYYLAYFKNSETAKEFVIYTIAISLINAITSLLLVAYLRIGVIGLVYAQLGAGALVFFVLTCKFATRLTPSLDKIILYDSLKTSYPLTPRIFLGIINTQFDKYLIGLIGTVGGVGVYSIGQRVSYVVFYFMTAIQNVFSPKVYQSMFDLEQEGSETIGKYLTPFIYISVFIALLVSVLSEEVISILTPPSYHGAIDIVIVLSMYYAFLFFGKVNSNQLMFAKKSSIISLLTMIYIAIGVGINIAFISKWGAVGAAWGTFLAGLISGLISYAISQYYYQIEWEFGKVATIFGVFYISSIMTILLKEADVAYHTRVLCKLVSTGIYAYVGIKIKVITWENLSVLKSAFGRMRFWKFEEGSAT